MTPGPGPTYVGGMPTAGFLFFLATFFFAVLALPAFFFAAFFAFFAMRLLPSLAGLPEGDDDFSVWPDCELFGAEAAPL